MFENWSEEEFWTAFVVSLVSGTLMAVWHVLSSALVWSSEAFVLVAWPWVVGFARGLLSFGGEFQSPECGRVRPGDTEPAHVSRCDGEYRGVELLRAWSRPWGGWVWLPAAFLAATLSLPLALACRPCLRKALNVVGRFLSPETVRELAGKEAQLAAARASEARLRGLLQSSDDKLKSRASTLQGIEGRLEERERSLVYYRKRESLLESACERLRLAGMDDDKELLALRGQVRQRSDAFAKSERAASEALETLKGEIEGVRSQLATTEQAARVELGRRAAAEAALAERKAASPVSTAVQTEPTTPDGNAVDSLDDLRRELEAAKTELASVTGAAAESRSALTAEMQARAEAFEGELQQRRSAEADFKIWQAQAMSEGRALFARCTEQEAEIVSLRGQLEQANRRLFLSSPKTEELEWRNTGCQDELMELDEGGAILLSEETETRPAEAMDESAPAEPGSPMQGVESPMTRCPEWEACEDYKSSEQKRPVSGLELEGEKSKDDEPEDEESDADDDAPGPGPYVPPPWQYVKRISYHDPYRQLGESEIRAEIVELARRLKQDFEQWASIGQLPAFGHSMDFLVGTLGDLLTNWSTLVTHRRQLFEDLLRETMLLDTIQSILTFRWHSPIDRHRLTGNLVEMRSRATTVWDWAPRPPLGDRFWAAPAPAPAQVQQPLPSFVPAAAALPPASAKRDRSPSDDGGRRKKR